MGDRTMIIPLQITWRNVDQCDLGNAPTGEPHHRSGRRGLTLEAGRAGVRHLHRQLLAGQRSRKLLAGPLRVSTSSSSTWSTHPSTGEVLQTFLLGMTDKARMLEKGNAQMDVTPLVRIPMSGRENLQWMVKQVLDMGAFGIVFPYVETREEAEIAVRSMRYPAAPRRPARRADRAAGRLPGIASWYWGSRDYMDPRRRLAAGPEWGTAGGHSDRIEAGGGQYRGDRFGSRHRRHLHRPERSVDLLRGAKPARPSGGRRRHEEGAVGVQGPGHSRAA
jgi:hypothetical protein